jgi:hypothetical protein
MHMRKKIMIHVVSWTAWIFIISSWAIIKWQYQPPLPVAYNLLSIIAAFYACRWMAAKYWKGIAKDTNMSVTDKGLEVKYPNAAYYILRWPFFGMIGIVFLFIIAAWYSEAYFIKHGFLPGPKADFYFFTYSSFISLSFYICGGNIMAAIEYHIRKEKERVQHLEEGFNEQVGIIKEQENEIAVLNNEIKPFFDIRYRPSKDKENNSLEDENEDEPDDE